MAELAPMACAHDASGKASAGVMPFFSSRLHCAMRPAHDQADVLEAEVAGAHDPEQGWNIRIHLLDHCSASCDSCAFQGLG
ncbi:MAG: hypothetical protein ACRDZY_17935, partial [Acidimicrobiales bacterium]